MLTLDHDQLYQDTITWLDRLIHFDTTSRNSNLKLIDAIIHYSKDIGLKTHIDYNHDKTKANLLVSIGPNIEGGIILSGHTDVVPTDGQDWSTPPFKLTHKDNRWFGRGTCDMKGFLACCLAMTPHFNNKNLTKPIYLCFSYDEEVGCRGVPTMVEYIANHIPKPAIAIIGEPTNMHVISAHKSIQCFRTTIIGQEAHSSAQHIGASAIGTASKLIDFLYEYIPNSSTDHRFTPPYNTTNIGTIYGGTAINIIAKECVFDWEMRTIPQTDINALLKPFYDYCNELEQSVQTEGKTLSITTKPTDSSPALQNQSNGDLNELILNLSGQNESRCVSFATEAGIFQQNGIPSIVYGPGDIEQAHKPNEFITSDQLQKCLVLLEKVYKKSI